MLLVANFLAKARFTSAILASFFTHSLRPRLAFNMAPLRPVAPFLGPISMKGIRLMFDLIYVALAVGGFLAFAVAVRACERL
ncbi:hypothetical protein [Sinorhizobium alkalisoli]|uniref:Uncharacterized protein n=1 Tax=Sinorhizobium alkalisoli TaxID=1752398 RepID=A0A1E3VHP3_9HYPH|nr:hypothetical protein [Sinorhizobium alkalisoli]ODR93088.1 hypothetical protein A8M32_01455 [Sinorhizobium alkalisoli]QFI70541.1 hypothetical protein EKH55_5667 [Sinorhizobium alkalisoli]